MKLALYTKAGTACFGAVVGDGIVTLNGRFGSGHRQPQRAAVGGCSSAAAAIVGCVHAGCAARRRDAAAPPDRRCQDPVCGAQLSIPMPMRLVVPFPSRMWASSSSSLPLWWRMAPRAHSRHVSDHFDFEGEICVVIGTGGVDIPQSEAMTHVAGYTCLMDGSVRDYQKNSRCGRQEFRRLGARRPWMVNGGCGGRCVASHRHDAGERRIAAAFQRGQS